MPDLELLALNGAGGRAATDDGPPEPAGFAVGGLAPLAGRSRRHTLELTDARLDDEALAVIARRPALRTLVLRGARGPSAEGWARLAGARGLTELNLVGVDLDDDTLARIGEGKPLVRLWLSDNPRLTDRGMAALSLADCPGLSDAALAAFARSVNLRRLYLTGNKQLTDAGLAPLGAWPPNAVVHALYTSITPEAAEAAPFTVHFDHPRFADPRPLWWSGATYP